MFTLNNYGDDYTGSYPTCTREDTTTRWYYVNSYSPDPVETKEERVLRRSKEAMYESWVSIMHQEQQYTPPIVIPPKAYHAVRVEYKPK